MVNYLEGEGHVSSLLWDFDYFSWFSLFFDMVRAANHSMGVGLW